MYNDAQEYLKFLIDNGVYITNEEIGNLQSLPDETLNPDIDWNLVEQQYNENKVAIIDNFLKEEYAYRLRDFTLFLNQRHDYYKEYAAINYFKDGLWFPLLSNIEKECKEKLSFVSDLELERAWSFIYNQESYGVDIHADPGPSDTSVNFNLWVTDNTSIVKDKDLNGLYIWNTAPPNDWDFYENNFKPAKVREFINNSQKDPISVDYKFNRVAIFNGKFYHKSQPIVTKPGYINKRINYTFMFR